MEMGAAMTSGNSARPFGGGDAEAAAAATAAGKFITFLNQGLAGGRGALPSARRHAILLRP